MQSTPLVGHLATIDAPRWTPDARHEYAQMYSRDYGWRQYSLVSDRWPLLQLAREVLHLRVVPAYDHSHDWLAAQMCLLVDWSEAYADMLVDDAMGIARRIHPGLLPREWSVAPGAYYCRLCP